MAMSGQGQEIILFLQEWMQVWLQEDPNRTGNHHHRQFLDAGPDDRSHGLVELLGPHDLSRSPMRLGGFDPSGRSCFGIGRSSMRRSLSTGPCSFLPALGTIEFCENYHPV